MSESDHTDKVLKQDQINVNKIQDSKPNDAVFDILCHPPCSPHVSIQANSASEEAVTKPINSTSNVTSVPCAPNSIFSSSFSISNSTSINSVTHIASAVNEQYDPDELCHYPSLLEPCYFYQWHSYLYESPIESHVEHPVAEYEALVKEYSKLLSNDGGLSEVKKSLFQKKSSYSESKEHETESMLDKYVSLLLDSPEHNESISNIGEVNEIDVDICIDLVELAEENPAIKDLIEEFTGKPIMRTTQYFHPLLPRWYIDKLSNETTIFTKFLEESTIVQDDAINKESALIPCVFTWSHGGHIVYLVGTFTQWQTNKIQMTRNGREFISIVKLPRAVHYYKYIVDDHWKYNSDQPTATDSQKNVNNVLDMTDYEPYNFHVPTEHEKAREDTYSQIIPSANDYTTDAPPIPLLLSTSHCVASEGPPQKTTGFLHSLANHLYHDSHSSTLFGPHITCVASTFRWRRAHWFISSLAGQRFCTITYVTFNPLFSYHGDPVFEIQTALPLRGIVGKTKSQTSKNKQEDAE